MSKGTGRRYNCWPHDAWDCRRCRVAPAKPSDRRRMQREHHEPVTLLPNPLRLNGAMMLAARDAEADT